METDVQVHPTDQPQFFEFTGSLGDGSDLPLLKVMGTSTHAWVVGEVVGGAGQHHGS